MNKERDWLQKNDGAAPEGSQYEQYKREEFLYKLKQNIPHMKELDCLELGCAHGEMTELLAADFRSVVAVDGASRYVKETYKKVHILGNVKVVEAMFEDVNNRAKFDVGILFHVLEHVKNPEQLLMKVRKRMSLGGKIAIVVPNAEALSRQLAVKMGLLERRHDLSDRDEKHGHLRVYDRGELLFQIGQAGLKVISMYGLSLKLFCDSQMEEFLSRGIIGESQIQGLWKLADEHINLAGALMVVAKDKNDVF